VGPYLTINSSGNVGIGTTTPSTLLEIASQNEIPPLASSGGSFSIQRTDNKPGMFAGLNAVGNFWIQVQRTDNAGVQSILLNPSGGNVGIGTASPNAKLEINNTANQPALSIGDSGLDPGPTYGMVNLTRPADTTRAHLAFIRTNNYVWQMGYVQNSNTFGIFPWNLNTGGMPVMAFATNGYIGIGTTTPSCSLDVGGEVHASAFVAPITGHVYADFVFKPGYKLAPLSDVEAAIKKDGHLPGIPDEAEAKAHGIDLTSMQVKLLQKIEELTLHQIDQEKHQVEQEKKLSAQESQLSNQAQRIENLEKENTELRERITK
jgi:hypothetical protein